MGTTLTRTRPAEVPAPRASRRKPPSTRVDFTAETVEETPAEEAEDLGEVDGVKIVAVEEVRNLPNAPFKGFVRLVLADKSTAFRCTNCPHTGTRGEVISHRQKEHGAANSWHTRVRRGEKQAKSPVELLTPDVASITLAEIMQFAHDRAVLAQLVEDLTTQRDEWKGRALAAEMSERRIAAAFDRLGYRKIEEEEL